MGADGPFVLQNNNFEGALKTNAHIIGDTHH